MTVTVTVIVIVIVIVSEGSSHVHCMIGGGKGIKGVKGMTMKI